MVRNFPQHDGVETGCLDAGSTGVVTNILGLDGMLDHGINQRCVLVVLDEEFVLRELIVPLFLAGSIHVLCRAGEHDLRPVPAVLLEDVEEVGAGLELGLDARWHVQLGPCRPQVSHPPHAFRVAF